MTVIKHLRKLAAANGKQQHAVTLLIDGFHLKNRDKIEDYSVEGLKLLESHLK